MIKQFKPVEWCERTSLYEVNVRQYSPEGTFAAFSKHLPRLRDMGIEVLWFMPVTPISLDKRQGTLGSYYACSDYTAINPEFGTLADFKTIVEAAHGLGMKVIIDWVANHTGYDHKWKKSNPEFYKKNDKDEFYDSNNWVDVIDLNYYDHAMRREMIKSMKFWVTECNIDGFRCDMAHLVPLDFWRDARQELDQVKSLFWLAETEDPHYLQAFDCCYAWDFMHASEKFIKGTLDFQGFVASLWRTKDNFPEDSYHLFFTSNHDENSWNGSEYEKYGYADKAMAVLTQTWNGIPLIYSGQELPNRKRLRFFDKDLIEWKPNPELHNFYKALIALRERNPALSAGYKNSQTTIIPVSNSKVLAYQRKRDSNEVIVVLNFGDQNQKIKLPEISGPYQDLFGNKKIDMHANTEFDLAKGEYIVLEK